MNIQNIGAIILTHKDIEKTVACLKAVHKQVELPYRIVLCDNGSGNEYADVILDEWIQIAKEQNLDEPVEVYATDTSRAKLVFLRLEENKGVGGGFNEALRFCFMIWNVRRFGLCTMIRSRSLTRFPLCLSMRKMKRTIKSVWSEQRLFTKKAICKNAPEADIGGNGRERQKIWIAVMINIPIPSMRKLCRNWIMSMARRV